MRVTIGILLSLLLVTTKVQAEEAMDIQAETAVIMEASTGDILYEKDSEKELPPASVTKVMTLLLIFDAIDDGKISLKDEVATSEYAASMGGSQVFLEVGEKQTVDTLIKCIAVSSANDACVTMAEYISGTEEAFVEQMNKRAKELGMKNTHFLNCNGLDADGHVTSAKDIALMSRELITKHPEILEYTQIWMDTIVHTTKKGSEEFGLSNTNKLIRHYEYATGLKTGSTSKAKFCLSATASKNGIDMIAVVMGEPDSKTRVKDAISLLNYGFSKCSIYGDASILEDSYKAKVKQGVKKDVTGEVNEQFQMVDTTGMNIDNIEKSIVCDELQAPVTKGQVIGHIIYKIDTKELGQVEILATEDVEELTFITALEQVLERFWHRGK